MGTAQNSTKISNSYATGSVKGAYRVGGLVGHDYSNTITIENSYWDINTTLQEKSAGGGTGKINDDMKKQSTYSGWDDTVWNIVNGEYPKLR